MAQTDSSSLPAFRHATPMPLVPKATPHEALAALPQLHRETADALGHAFFCARAVPTAGTLLVLGTPFRVHRWRGAGAGVRLEPRLVLVGGIGAMIANTLRGQAHPFADGLAETAANLRAILLYMGTGLGRRRRAGIRGDTESGDVYRFRGAAHRAGRQAAERTGRGGARFCDAARPRLALLLDCGMAAPTWRSRCCWQQRCSPCFSAICSCLGRAGSSRQGSH